MSRFTRSLRTLLSHLSPLVSGREGRITSRSDSQLRPHLECLEDRLVPTVTYHGGALLTNVEVQPVYIGNQWSANSTLWNEVGTFNGFLSTIVNSSYMDALTNAGYGVGRGSYSPGIVSEASLANNSILYDSTIRSWLNSYVSNGELAPNNSNRLYVCFIEPNIEIVNNDYGDDSDFLAYHMAFGSNNGVIHYAVIPTPGGTVGNGSLWYLSTVDTMTMAASHEIAEAVTDPNVDYSTMGWYDNAHADGEIGDMAAGNTMYIDGYAMQRVVNQDDFPMTPSQATSSRPVNFVLQSNGDLVEMTTSGSTVIAYSVASISDQGVDIYGRATVDYFTGTGSVYQYDDGLSSILLLANSARSAVAGQGVSYILSWNGQISEYNQSTGATTSIYSYGTQISAGTDAQGVNEVNVLFSWGDAYEHSDDTGWSYIASGVSSISGGRGGISDYITTSGVAHWHTQSGSDSIIGYGVSQLTAGTNANGGYMIDLLFTSGYLYQYDSASGAWTYLDNNVTSISKAHVGVEDMVFSWGDAYTYTGYWQYLTGSAESAC